MVKAQLSENIVEIEWTRFQIDEIK